MKELEIYDKLKSVPKEYLKTIQAGRLKGMSDIKPQWRIQKITEVFGTCGFGWKIANLRFEYKNGSDDQIVCMCYLELFIKVNEIWSDAIIGVGGSSFVAKESTKHYTSDEAEKMSYTDALSVAMKMIGMASDVYMGHGGKYDAPTEPPKKPQLTLEGYNFLISKATKEQIKEALNTREMSNEQRKELETLCK